MICGKIAGQINKTMNNNQHYNNSIFWIEVEKIKPNPYQPRKEFSEGKLEDLAESIKQYGILQPLVATRHEVEKEDGGLVVEYELIAGERRLRASKIANLVQVPVIIRTGKDDDKLKLELAIIENLQREDLNPVDRAQAFQRFVNEFNYKHIEIAKKIGKSREYVSNSLRLLLLPEDMLNALAEGKITEGHTRPILMLSDRPEEQATLFKELIFKRLTVRETERIARRIAQDKVRKKGFIIDPEIIEIEEKLTEKFGTRVQIDKKEFGGKITIDFFSNDDLDMILNIVNNSNEKFVQQPNPDILDNTSTPELEKIESTIGDTEAEKQSNEIINEQYKYIEEEKKDPDTPKEQDDDMYFIKNFSL